MKSKTANFILKLIIFDRLVIGSLLILLSMGLIKVIDQDLGALGNNIARILNLDVDNEFINKGLTNLSGIDSKIILGVSLGALLYGILILIQAYGLYRRKRWAEYLTVIAIAIFIPFEVYEILQKQTLIRFSALGLNIAIVVFLIRHKELFPKRGRCHHAEQPVIQK